MRNLQSSILILAAAGVTALGALLLKPRPANGFTQSGVAVGFGDSVPMGQEWITRLAALELLGDDPVIPPDPNDPRKTWTYGKAKNLDLSGAGTHAKVQRLKAQRIDENRYASTFTFVLDAILGEPIFNLFWDNYLWLSKESPYLSRAGNPKNRDAQWRIERVPSIPAAWRRP